MTRPSLRQFAPLLLCLSALACTGKPPLTSPQSLRPSQTTPSPAAIIPTPIVPTTIVLGQTVESRPLTLYLFGDPSIGPANTVLIFGGIHGSEPTSAGICRELLTYLAEHPAAWRGRCVALIPEANPDGLARHFRTNKNLIDLNRNFPAKNWAKTRKSSFYGGVAPATEPETNLLMAAVEKYKPARIVSVHSMEVPCNNYDGPGEALARLLAAHNGYPIRASIGYPTPGSFGSWAGTDRGIPVITLELPHNGTTAKSWAANRDGLLAFIRGG